MVESAQMSWLSAKVSSWTRIAALESPVEDALHRAVVAAMKEGASDEKLCKGGVQAVAMMELGIESLHSVDMLVGSGNA